MREKISGEGWSRAALGFGATLSVIGNVAHTALAASPVSLWLRVPFAVVWPLALFVAVEVLVRVPWRHRFIDWFGRLVLILPVSAVAAVVSYQHLHQLMQLAAEDVFSSTIGPLAVDGLMLGGTTALLAIRAVRMVTAALEDGGAGYVEYDVEAPATPEATLTYAEPEPAAAPVVERRPRPSREDQRKAVGMLLDGQSVADTADASGVGKSVVGRFATVLSRLRDDPLATDFGSATGKVHPELVAVMRDAMKMGRAL